jgi:hypothetical protein
MSWQRFYNLLVKYGGDVEQVPERELKKAGEDCPFAADAHLSIAQTYYRRLTRRKNKQLQIL